MLSVVNVVLVANARPDFEMFVIPVVNVIISSILLLGCLKMFSSMVVYKHREKYLDVIDSEKNTVQSRLHRCRLAEPRSKAAKWRIKCPHSYY